MAALRDAPVEVEGVVQDNDEGHRQHHVLRVDEPLLCVCLCVCVCACACVCVCREGKGEGGGEREAQKKLDFWTERRKPLLAHKYGTDEVAALPYPTLPHPTTVAATSLSR